MASLMHDEGGLGLLLLVIVDGPRNKLVVIVYY
jgi:hypothetical protein